jgi:hypothetical protein
MCTIRGKREKKGTAQKSINGGAIDNQSVRKGLFCVTFAMVKRANEIQPNMGISTSKIERVQVPPSFQRTVPQVGPCGLKAVVQNIISHQLESLTAASFSSAIFYLIRLKIVTFAVACNYLKFETDNMDSG